MTSFVDVNGYYRALGVPPTASPEHIKAAYRAKAKELHPDKNKGPGATELFQALVDAYAVLKDPTARRRYDDACRQGTTFTREPGTPRPAPEPVPFVPCQVCGIVSPDVRVVLIHWVWSALVFTRYGANGVVACPTCAARLVERANIRALLLGWWGVPWGVWFTPRQVLRNVFGRRGPDDVNARLLIQQALAYAMRDDFLHATKCLMEARLLAANHPDILKDVEEIARQLPPQPNLSVSDAWRPFSTVFRRVTLGTTGALSAVALAVALLIAPPSPSTPTIPAETSSVDTTTASSGAPEGTPSDSTSTPSETTTSPAAQEDVASVEPVDGRQNEPIWLLDDIQNPYESNGEQPTEATDTPIESVDATPEPAAPETVEPTAPQEAVEGGSETADLPTTAEEASTTAPVTAEPAPAPPTTTNPTPTAQVPVAPGSRATVPDPQTPRGKPAVAAPSAAADVATTPTPPPPKTPASPTPIPPQATSTRSYFTIGDSKDDVRRVMGQPSSFDDSYWIYGFSTVWFENDHVVRWEDHNGSLKAKLEVKPGANKGYFTVGDSKDDVLRVMGQPSSFDDSYWIYGFSTVWFENDRVVRWDDNSGKLKAKLNVPSSEGKTYFTVGDSKDDVLRIMGQPSSFDDSYWIYGFSTVWFEGDRVVRWDDNDGKLKAKLEVKPGANKAYFTVGDSKDDVLRVMGQPSSFDDSYWIYGFSTVWFENDRVVRWDDNDGKLKAKLQ